MLLVITRRSPVSYDKTSSRRGTGGPRARAPHGSHDPLRAPVPTALGYVHAAKPGWAGGTRRTGSAVSLDRTREIGSRKQTRQQEETGTARQRLPTGSGPGRASPTHRTKRSQTTARPPSSGSSRTRAMGPPLPRGRRPPKAKAARWAQSGSGRPGRPLCGAAGPLSPPAKWTLSVRTGDVAGNPRDLTGPRPRRRRKAWWREGDRKRLAR